MRFLVTAGLAVVLPAAALAGPAADAVRYFYEHPGAERDAEQRHRFTGDALAKVEANARAAEADGLGCLDFDLAHDAQDFDENEVLATLVFDEGVADDFAEVTARFQVFGKPRAVTWRLTQIDGEWKVTDVAGETWRLSRLDCPG